VNLLFLYFYLILFIYFILLIDQYLLFDNLFDQCLFGIMCRLSKNSMWLRGGASSTMRFTSAVQGKIMTRLFTRISMTEHVPHRLFDCIDNFIGHLLHPAW